MTSISRIYLLKGQQFSMFSKFKNLTSSYDDLVVIFPNILGNKLPNFLKKIRFYYWGTASVTTTAVEADFFYDNSSRK
jgi:hypothetical protein